MIMNFVGFIWYLNGIYMGFMGMLYFFQQNLRNFVGFTSTME